jgi:hypothetical protein
MGNVPYFDKKKTFTSTSCTQLPIRSEPKIKVAPFGARTSCPSLKTLSESLAVHVQEHDTEVIKIAQAAPQLAEQSVLNSRYLIMENFDNSHFQHCRLSKPEIS